jgi:hypothetical protein
LTGKSSERLRGNQETTKSSERLTVNLGDRQFFRGALSSSGRHPSYMLTLNQRGRQICRQADREAEKYADMLTVRYIERIF